MALAFLVVGAATLTPSPGNTTSTDFWCVACGELGGVDVVANIGLFVPLGFALALLLGRRRTPILVCIAITLIIELLQVRVVVGRDSSLSDLLSNSIGGWIGVELALGRQTIVSPDGPTARRLALMWAGAVAALLAVTSWALRPAYVPNSLWIQWVPQRAGNEPFTGRLISFDVDGIDLPNGFPKSSLGLARHLRSPSWRATAVADTHGLTPARSVIARVAEEATVLVSLDQTGWALTCLQKTRSAEFLFRSPKVALVDAFRPPGVTGEPRVQLSCARRDGGIEAGAKHGGGARAYRLPLSPSLGWLLMAPFDIAFDARFRLASAAWLLALLVPVGYWSSAAQRDQAVKPNASRTWIVGFAAALVALTIGLTAVPLALGTATAAWWEWGAALAGVALGAIGFQLLRRGGPAGDPGSASTRSR